MREAGGSPGRGQWRYAGADHRRTHGDIDPAPRTGPGPRDPAGPPTICLICRSLGEAVEAIGSAMMSRTFMRGFIEE